MPHPLIAGYRRWRQRDLPAEIAERHHLASHGQRPHTMIVGCADSRVSPSRIFDAAPGELFVVRNVANLVPPCEADRLHHGTSAALEFAVVHLEVSRILILGHSGCGGIAAALGEPDPAHAGEFIGSWVALIHKARDRVLADPEIPAKDRQAALEREAIRLSLDRLEGFPFIAEETSAGRLSLDGAWFDIASGELHWLNRASGNFISLDEREPDLPSL